jgi:hypothetical protein
MQYKRMSFAHAQSVRANKAARLEKIPGIVAHGLFLGCANAAPVARGSDLLVLRPNLAAEPIGKFQALP